MIYLITATPGSGKTLWAVKEIFARANEAEPWNIFSNIDGLKLDTAQPLKDDFNDYPPRSLVVIDEAQQIKHFSKKFKGMHDQVEFLQTHRHAEMLDIIFITQAPRLLNADVLDMVGMHYHLHRPMGMKMATWWLWKHHQLNPNTKSVKSDAEDTGTFTYPKHLFNMYTSTKGGTDSHGKIKLPAKLVSGIWMLFLAVCAALYFGYKSQSSDTKEEPKSIKTEIPKAADPLQKKVDECVKQLGWSAEMCKEGLDPEYKAKRDQETLANTHNDMQSISVKYNPNKPYEVDTSKIEYQVTSKPVFSGCMKKGSRYVAYTEQGTILRDVSQSDCRKLIENNDRPYNYFKQQAQGFSNQPQQVQQFTNQPQTQEYDAEFIAKYQAAKAQGLI
ncbi:zonular occludens toxin domain-containing protein [Acinetobacter baumannii]|uniref:zonular occludens toxin domain-containing protein n=1 Tax=Acinetobacter baumannii TaxID=470 RepID=UPI001CDBE612|nr:zonular occludens toxin domain-containing protein [Acinetobacter baumannii]MCA4230825.1 zonular occludens toxin domain-containing protein [Acinetobacter baumannii]MDC4799649.1 zonular occludens toxin domain-containing protein [Acinetobacter baumannii]MDC5538885.1 zonular occludens toxin domain-containing protein [Acinetobacter baumannii]